MQTKGQLVGVLGLLPVVLITACAGLDTPGPIAAGDTSADRTGPVMVAFRKDGQSTVRFESHPELDATRCLTLNMKWSGPGGRKPVLTNHCAYPVTYAFCLDDQSYQPQSCSQAGSEVVEHSTLNANGTVALDLAGNPEDSEVRWLACRDEAGDAYARLTDGSTRGECHRPRAQPDIQKLETVVNSGAR